MCTKIATTMIACLLLSGCLGIGGHWMEGNPSGGENLTPIRDYWVFPGGTAEERARQWVACGGTDIGGSPHSPFSETRKTHSEIVKESKERYYKLQICMVNNGYRYIGSCKGKNRGAQPACVDRAPPVEKR